MTWTRHKWNGRHVGLLNRSLGVYRLYRRDSVHLARKYDAYGINVEIIDDLQRAGVHTIEVYEMRQSGSTWMMRVPLDEWLRYGVKDTLREQDGAQIFLAVNRMGKGVQLAKR